MKVNNFFCVKNIFFLMLMILATINPLDLFSQDANEKHVLFLKKFRSEYIQSMLSKRPEMIQQYYTEDVRLMPEFQKTIIGRLNTAHYFQTFLKRFDILEYSRTETEVLDLGTRISEIGTFREKLKLRSNAKEYELIGKYLNIWEKFSDGKLMLLTEAWNYNHALEFEDQLRFTEVAITDVALKSHVPVKDNISFELAALNRLMENTVSQHDAKIWLQFYSDDGMFCYSRHPIIRGKKEIGDFLDNHCKELPVFEKLDIRNDCIDNVGTYVIEYASHIAVYRSGDYSGVGLGKDLRIWRREKDGSLKILRHFGMYD